MTQRPGHWDRLLVSMLWLAVLLTLPFRLHAAAANTIAGEVKSAASSKTRFTTVEVWIDAKEVPLAAYQLSVRTKKGTAKLVGVEGGNHPAFAEPAHYDSKALQQDRIILAAFSLLPPSKLPTGSVRVARLHVQVRGNEAPEFELRLILAADSEGRVIPAKATLKPQ